MATHRGNRRSVRLLGYDYAQAGAYFITLVAHGRECLFGEILQGEMRLNEAGRVVEEEWLRTPTLRPQVELDAFVVMPNHLHAVAVIGDGGRGVLQYAPTNRMEPQHGAAFRSPSQTVGAMVRGFKGAATARLNAMCGVASQPVWQRNYYEHVIRDAAELDRVREYIKNNPVRWDLDQENPANWHRKR